MAIKKFSSYIEEQSPAQDYVATKDSDKEVKGYQPRSKGEQDFANMHNVQKTDYAIPGQDHIFNGTVVKEEVELTERKDTAYEVAKLIKRMGVKQNAPESEILKKVPDALKKLGLQNDRMIKRDPDFQGDVIDDFRSMKEEIQLDEREDTATQVARELKKMGVKSNAKEADIIKKIPDVLKKMGLGNNKLIKRDPDFIGDVLDSMNEEFDLIEGKVMDALQKIVNNKSAGSVKFENGKTLKVDMTTANAMLNLHKKINDKNKAKMADQIEKSPEVFMKLMDLAFGGK